MAKDENRFANLDWLKFDRDQAFALLPILEEIAAARQCSMAQLAIAWLLTRPGADSVLLGATKTAQLEDNLGAADVVLSEDDLARLDEATKIAPIYPSSDWVEIDPVARKRLGAQRK